MPGTKNADLIIIGGSYYVCLPKHWVEYYKKNGRIKDDKVEMRWDGEIVIRPLPESQDVSITRT